MPDDVKQYISKIRIGSTDYEIKDTTARELIAKGIKFVVSTNAADTPLGVTWITKEGTSITGTLEPSSETVAKIYLVLASGTAVQTVYSEYVTVTHEETTPVSYTWEKLGDTSAQIKGLVRDVKYVGGTTKPGSGDIVLGEATTFTNASSSVSFTGGTNDDFVKSYPGVTNKLEVGTITGINGSQSVTGIASNTTVTASKATAAADKVASIITTESKTATNTVLGTPVSASKATAGTAVNVATTDTAVSFNAMASAQSDIVRNMRVIEGETLTFDLIATSSKTITPAKANGTITPYSFSDVSVPVISSNTEATISSVKTNNDVTITQFTFADVDASKVVNDTAFNAAKPAATASSFATGSISSTGTGGSVMIGLGEASTAKAVTGVGTGTAAAQTITVGTNDKVKVGTYDDSELNVTKVE